MAASLSLVDLRGSEMHQGDRRTGVQEGEDASKSPPTNGLHISLTRPFTIRSYERDEYVKIASQEVHRLRKELER